MKQGLELALVHLDRKGRLVVPKRIRDKTGIKVGDLLFVYSFEKLVFLRKAAVDHKPTVEAIRRLGE